MKKNLRYNLSEKEVRALLSVLYDVLYCSGASIVFNEETNISFFVGHPHVVLSSREHSVLESLHSKLLVL